MDQGKRKERPQVDLAAGLHMGHTCRFELLNVIRLGVRGSR